MKSNLVAIVLEADEQSDDRAGLEATMRGVGRKVEAGHNVGVLVHLGVILGGRVLGLAGGRGGRRVGRGRVVRLLIVAGAND